MRSMSWLRNGAAGQTLIETALVMPLVIAVITGTIVVGIGLFYQQQVDNAAREAARYAAIHSATSQCPTPSSKPVNPAMVPAGNFLVNDPDCDQLALGWPFLTAHARSQLFGMNPSGLRLSACWSGYTDYFTGAHDAAPTTIDPSTMAVQPNDWQECTIGGVLPLTQTESLPCPPPAKSATDDKASNLAVSEGLTANRVSVYVCYAWSPPLAGFLLIPETVTFRAAVAESMQHQR